MKKITALLIASLFLFLAANYCLIIFLPEKIKTTVTALVKENYGGEIKIGDAEINIFQGVILKNIVLSRPDQTFCLKIENLRILPLYPSLLLPKKIILSVEADNAYCLLRRTSGKKIDFPEIHPAAPSKADFLLNHISIKNMELEFVDESANFGKIFTPIDAEINPGITDIRFTVKWTYKLTARGRYYFNAKAIEADIFMDNLELKDLNAYLKNTVIEKGRVKNGKFKLSKKIIEGAAKIENVAGSYLAAAENGQITKVTFSGNAQIYPKFSLAGVIPHFEAAGLTCEGELKNLPLLGDIKNTKGSFLLSPEKIIARNIAADLGNVPVTAKGEYNFNSANYAVAIKTGATAPDTIEALKRLKIWDSGGNIGSGKINLAASLGGNSKLGTFDYKITADLEKISTKDGEIKDAIGRVSIENGRAFLEQCALDYNGISIIVSGKIEDFADPSISWEIKTMAPAAQFFQTMVKAQKKYLPGRENNPGRTFNIEVLSAKLENQRQGTIDIEGTINGRLSQKNLNYLLNYKIEGLNFDEIRDLQLKGRLKNNEISVEKAVFKYKNFPFSLSGRATGLATPRIKWKFALAGDILKAAGQGKYRPGTLTIDALNLKTEASEISASGDITSGGAERTLKGRGQIDTDGVLKTLTALGFNFPAVEKINPSGIINIGFTAETAAALSDWTIHLDATSKEMTVFKIPLSRMELHAVKNKTFFTISPLLADAAGGKIELRLNADFGAGKTTYDLITENIELSNFREYFKLKKKKLAGKMYLEAKLESAGFFEFGKMSGSGAVTIKKGNIWELNMLKGLGKFLFIPDFGEIKFETGYSDLFFKNNEVIFQNLELDSLQMNLKGAEKISLKGDIDFMLFPTFNPLLIDASDSLKKITTGLLGKGFLYIHVGGTIEKPQYKPRPSLLQPLKNIKDFLKNLAGG